MQDLELDPNIRDYVFIPMVIAVFVFGIIRFYLAKLMSSSPDASADAPKLLKPVEVQEFEELPKADTILADSDKESAYKYPPMRCLPYD